MCRSGHFGIVLIESQKGDSGRGRRHGGGDRWTAPDAACKRGKAKGCSDPTISTLL